MQTLREKPDWINQLGKEFKIEYLNLNQPAKDQKELKWVSLFSSKCQKLKHPRDRLAERLEAEAFKVWARRRLDCTEDSSFQA